MGDINEQYWLFLCKIEGLGNVQTDRLLECFGSAADIYRAGEQELFRVENVRPEVIERIIEERKHFDPEREYEVLQKENIRFVCRQSVNYPERLHHIANPPNGLFYIGALPEDDSPALAIVGSRTCSAYGREVSLKFSGELAKMGISIISGMAAGVDGYSHRGAIRAGGLTYAVLGSGVDICYPKTNRDIYEEIRERGGLISEYYPGSAPLSVNFPRRNRIISALSDGILVVEARERSGTWITVDMGLEQGKEIFTIPGRINEPLSIGCNRLIRQGARLVMTPEDVLADLAPKYGFLVNRGERGDLKPSKTNEKLTALQEKILDNLSLDPMNSGQLAAIIGADLPEVMAALTLLEMRGICHFEGNGFFTLSL